jgi:hypothetical protein
MTEKDIREYFEMEDFFNKTMDINFYVRVVNT